MYKVNTFMESRQGPSITFEFFTILTYNPDMVPLFSDSIRLKIVSHS